MSSKGQDGTGLGLATASESLRRIDGQLVHRVREGGGAEFVIMLQLFSPPEVQPAPIALDLVDAIRRVLA